MVEAELNMQVAARLKMLTTNFISARLVSYQPRSSGLLEESIKEYTRVSKSIKDYCLVSKSIKSYQRVLKSIKKYQKL